MIDQLLITLNECQRQLLGYLADGKRYEDIAILTGRTPGTVKQQGLRLMNQMHAETIAHAVAIGYRLGILSLYSPVPPAAPFMVRRGEHEMCQPCQLGKHNECPDENCPCVCNDEDFRFRRTARAS